MIENYCCPIKVANKGFYTKKGKGFANSPKVCNFAVTKKTKNYITMDKGTTNSGIPVFGEIVKMLDKQKIDTLAAEMNANRYTKRLDAYQHLVIMLYAQLGRFESLRDLELGFLSAASRMNHFGMDYMVRRSTLSDANAAEALHSLRLCTKPSTMPIRPFWRTADPQRG